MERQTGTRMGLSLPDPAGSLCPWEHGWEGREPEVEGSIWGSLSPHQEL